MFKAVLFMFLNLFSLAVLGLPTGGESASHSNANRAVTANIGGIVTAGFDAPGALLTLHASGDCSGSSQGSYYLLSGQPIYNVSTGGTFSISVGSNSDNTQINFFDQSNASGNMMGSSTGNNVCAKFGAAIKSAKLLV
ncbi:hypothetical protein PG994_003495 [Apiospora phragmitis]|uniref:Uncharacterized protein n=1 Tax=Apiospora phragmitis TaxID=2905665 RepID=A0ABR1VYC8_9PEZI